MKINALRIIAMLLISNAIIFFVTSTIADENQPQLPASLEQADLSIFKSTNVEIAYPGQSIIYTLNITNNGPNTASNVIVYDFLSSKVTFDISNPPQNGFNGSTYWWDIGSLNVNQSQQITINVNINDDATGTIINNANVTSDTYDPSNKYNNDSVQVSIVTIADLSITKTANTNFVYVGDYIIYTINVTNNGPDDAENVIIYDTLPNEVTFNHAEPAPGGNSDSVYWWYYSSLGVGESIIITVNVTVNLVPAGTINNIANVTSDTYDPTPSNSEDNEQTNISQPSSGGGAGNGGGTANLHPNADPNGPYFGFIGEEIEFDGTGSHDNDEGGLSIVQYDWKFFDEDNWHLNMGVAPKYIYYEVGFYNVTLRVIDDEGSSSIGTTTVTIYQANLPPTLTINNITGIFKGHQNISYPYTISAYDPDGDNITYTVNWGDGSGNISDSFANGITYNVNHMWIAPGHYVITVYATDEQDSQSDEVSLGVLIDIHYVKDIGYLIDFNSDGIYDKFYSNNTRKETNTEKLDDGRYLINDDDDDQWEWIYNPETDTLENYYYGEQTDLTLWYILIILILLCLITIFLLLYNKKKKKETPMETSTQQQP